MESGSEQLPLKVCRHCSVASRTESSECPACGRGYERGGFKWRWWYAIPIVAVAFAGGYFGLSQLVYDDPEPISAEEAAAVEVGTPRSEVEDLFGEPSQTSEAPTPEFDECAVYEIDGDSEQEWLFCFADDVVGTSGPAPAD